MPESTGSANILFKIVTLQHIYSLYLATLSNTGSPNSRKDITFNITTFQSLINNNPLINEKFDLLDIKGSIAEFHRNNEREMILKEEDIVNIIIETLSLDHDTEVPIITRIPDTTVYRMSNLITIPMVKDRLIKILNSYKNVTLEEIAEIESAFKKTRAELNETSSVKKEETMGTPVKVVNETPARFGDTEKPDISSLKRKRSPTPGTPTPASTKRFQTIAYNLMSQITSNRFASTFLQPVSSSDEPEYYDVIKHPKDIKSIQREIRSGKIGTFEELELALQIMFANAIMYNEKDSEVSQFSIEMMESCDKVIELFRESLS